MNIMFICTGNICRSAMAHVMLEKMVEEKNKNVNVYSSGIYAKNGDKPTFEAITTLQENYNIDVSKHKATNTENSQIKLMDIILCATQSHKAIIINMYPELKEKVFTIKEFAGYPTNDLDIQDPWGCSYNSYVKCAAEINDCLNKIIDKI